MKLPEVVDRLAAEGLEALPVVDDQGAYRGIVTSYQVEEGMRANALEATAADLAQAVPPAQADESLEQAVQRLMASGAIGLVVLDHPDGRVIGWFTHRDVLAAYSKRLGPMGSASRP